MKPKVLIICQHFGIPEHQTKIIELSRFWDITAITANNTSAFGWTEAVLSHQLNNSLALIALNNWGPLKSGTKFIFLGLKIEVREPLLY